MKKYDLTVLLKTEVAGEGKDKFVEKLEKTAKALGGKVTKTTEMGKKQLAYRIKKAAEAEFVGFMIEMPAPAVVQLDKKLSIDKEVLRHLLIIAGE